MFLSTEKGSHREEVGLQNISGGSFALLPSSNTTKVDESSSHTRGTLIPSEGVSYAIAIYPYMAEQADELDIVVDDYFIILSRTQEWWLVRRDQAGTGVFNHLDASGQEKGWVPAGCLLETNVPVASAIAEATAQAANSDRHSSSSNQRHHKMPIIPSSIVTTSFPAIALMDYEKKGEEELSLKKEDALRVFKKYNNWLYAAKDINDDRGWVPSEFVGGVSAENPTVSNTTVFIS